MAKDVFDYLNYKRYLQDVIKHRPGAGHGFRTRIAKAADCQVSYVSEVLNKASHFSLEQAEAINELLDHTPEESEFFLMLVQLERAGSRKLRDRIRNSIDNALKARLVLKDRVDIKAGISSEDQPIYYSSWQYAAVHLLGTIKAYQRPDLIAEYLRLPAKRVNEIVDFLVSLGLLKIDRGRLEGGPNRFWIGNDSPMLSKHHANWRLRALDSLDQGKKDDIHYSALVSLASEDVAAIKEKIAKDMDSTRALVRDSKNENEIHCFAVDFFKV